MLGPQTTTPAPTHPQGPRGPGREKRSSLLSVSSLVGYAVASKASCFSVVSLHSLRVFLTIQLLNKASQAAFTANMGCNKNFDFTVVAAAAVRLNSARPVT